MASKDIAEETKNTLDLIKKGLSNPAPWLVNNTVAADNTRVANYTAAFNVSKRVPINTSKSFKELLQPEIEKSNVSKGLKILMEAHGTQEGFIMGSRAQRNNNPGNLAYSNLLAQNFGALLEPPNPKGERRFAYFSTLALGVKAKADYITRATNKQHSLYTESALKEKKKKYNLPSDPKELSLELYMYTYAPPNENDTENYINFIIQYFKEKNNITITRFSLLKDIISIN